MTKQSSLVALFSALAFFALSGSARADGAVIAKAALSGPTRAGLQAAIAKAKASEPAAFTALDKVVAGIHGSAKRTRHAKPTVTRELQRLGAPALYPLIELTAFESKRGALDDAEWRALGDGAIQALAFLRDKKASPVLAAVFSNGKDSLRVEHAAEGLGMLCGDAERGLLLGNLDAASPRRAAAITGLGYCHRKDVAEQLALALDDPSPDIAARAARALGFAGSSWALAADTSVSPDEQEELRAFASHALLEAFTKRDKPVRDVIYRAVLMVDHASAPSEVALAKARAPELRAELERLEHRLELNKKRARP